MRRLFLLGTIGPTEATWTLRKTALLVNEIDPAISTRSDFRTPIARAPLAESFSGLRKSERRAGLVERPPPQFHGEPLYSPGTLVRRLVERGKHAVSARLRKAVERPDRAPGPSRQNRTGRKIRFRPSRPTDMGRSPPHYRPRKWPEELEKLPSVAHSDRLPSVSKITIRKYLVGHRSALQRVVLQKAAGPVRRST